MVTNLKQIRKASGLTQAALAEKAGISLRTLQDYEQGQKPINQAAVITVFRIASALNCKIEDLIEKEARE